MSEQLAKAKAAYERICFEDGDDNSADEWVRRYGKPLLALLAELEGRVERITEPGVVKCYHCKETVVGREAMDAHTLACPAHPMRQVEAERDALRAQLARYTLPDPDLNAIEARAKAATEGPWIAEAECDLDGNNQPELWIIMRGQPMAYKFDRKDDANLIAHARQDIPALLARIRRGAAELAGLREIVAKLPRTADGVPVTPGMLLYPRHKSFSHIKVDAVVSNSGDLTAIGMDGEFYNRWYSTGLDNLYSTREAALAAAKNPNHTKETK